jgi:hypothetical protein
VTRLGWYLALALGAMLPPAIDRGAAVAFAATPDPVNCARTPGPGPGVVDPFHVPTAAAKQLNADALAFYRQGRWDDARAKYRASIAADPDFLAPAMNIACSFVRQERFGEAMTEVRSLLARAFIPWNDEVLTAADLGALKVGALGKELRALLEDQRREWATGLADDVLFIARTRAPLGIGRETPAAAATFVLGPRQEIFAWSPRTNRYRQLTTEQGRVLALGRSRDGRRLAYATGEKLVLAPGTSALLRGMVIKELDLGTLTVLAEARVSGDVRRVDILPVPTGFAFRIEGPTLRASTFSIKEGQLEPILVQRTAKPVCTLTGAGGTPLKKPLSLSGECAGSVRDGRGSTGTPEVELTARHTTLGALSGPFGGGLCGLPIP